MIPKTHLREFKPFQDLVATLKDLGADTATLFIEAEKMGDFVDHGDLDLPLQFLDCFTHLFQGRLEDVDRVGIEGRWGKEGREGGRRKAGREERQIVESRGYDSRRIRFWIELDCRAGPGWFCLRNCGQW